MFKKIQIRRQGNKKKKIRFRPSNICKKFKVFSRTKTKTNLKYIVIGLSKLLFYYTCCEQNKIFFILE